MSKSTKKTTAANNETAQPEGAMPSVDAVRAKATATLNGLVVLGTAWAGTGLGYVRLAIESGARALDRAAKTVESYQERFKKTEEKQAA